MNIRPDPNLSDYSKPLQFNFVDIFVPEADKSKKVLNRNLTTREAPDFSKEPEEYRVVLYGSTSEGNTVCAEVIGYQPYFYLRIPDSYLNNSENLNEFVTKFKNYIKNGEYKDQKYYNKYFKNPLIIGKWYKSHLVSVKLEYRKEFMGFTNGTLFPFIKITVKSLALFNRLKYFFQTPPADFKLKYPESFKL
jgi:hypothetical protein